MPEYLAPGVYVEETSYRPKSIEGVSTSTTAFVGPTLRGPILGTPEVITSSREFTRIYGGLTNLSFSQGDDADPPKTNYMAHAVRSFFENGGSRLYIGRTFIQRTGPASNGVAQSDLVVDNADGRARFVARMPGSGLNGVIKASEKRMPASPKTMGNAPEGSMLRLDADEGAEPEYYVKGGQNWVGADPGTTLDTTGDLASAQLVTMTLETKDASGNIITYEDLEFSPAHPRRYIGSVLSEQPSCRVDALENPYYFDIATGIHPVDLREGIFGTESENKIRIQGGNDGVEPTATSTVEGDVSYEDALELLEDIEDVSIIAAPGHSAFSGYRDVQERLISHAEHMKYRIAVLDTPPGQGLAQARETRSFIDSTYAALYYPWVVIANPLARLSNERIPKEIHLPPSGFVAGIYARNDNQVGVWKAPANEKVRGALRLEREINHRQQEVLNPEGINCLRYFFGRGNRIWGARTASSDPEWKYVNVRRYFIYVERSIDRSTQWVVFEPNGERLWANVCETVSAFLYNEWRSGALLGTKPEESYFVRCDRSTMTQNDLDNGRLICEIGVAVLKPAEFVIFRIGQKTADARS